MPNTTSFLGILLIVLGGWGYTQSVTRSPMALIPSVLGVLFLALGIAAGRDEWRKHAMHAAAGLALVGGDRGARAGDDGAHTRTAPAHGPVNGGDEHPVCALPGARGAVVHRGAAGASGWGVMTCGGAVPGKDETPRKAPVQAISVPPGNFSGLVASIRDVNAECSAHDPYVFEFLGLESREVMGESALEDALLDKLQQFLLEMGHGFCFEARQKRLVIGGEHFFVDLVFYHRVLKCHVLVELKTDAFRHEHLGQLNAYVSYYRETQMTEGDQPPVGILLCTAKNHALVEYALAGMTNALFVSRYQVQLPGKTEMRALVERAMEELGGGGERE